MGLPQTAFRPLARLAGVHASRQLRRFLDAHRRTAEVQEDLLRRLLAASGGTAFGRDHALERVRGYEDLCRALPVGDFETHRPYVQRVLEGDVRAMFPAGERVLMFAVTSGTTGAPKHIPVTSRFLREYRRGWNVFGLRVLQDHPAGWMRKIVAIASSPAESVTTRGVPCGSISGLLAEKQKWIVRRMYPVPARVRRVRDHEARYYATIRASICQDVGVLTTANPSAAIRLAEVAREHAERLVRDVRDGTLNPPGRACPELAGVSFRPDPPGAARLEGILARHGELLPKHFWNLAFMTLWTGGTLGLYLPRVREYYGQVPIRDIGLLASEGRLSVPLADETPAGVAEITSNFLEFIPADQVESDRPDVLRAHEVEVGREYFVIVSNWAGLWRYNIDDRVRVVDRLGDSPVIEFLSKGLHTSSITGEKITEHQVVEALGRAAAELGLRVDTFTLQGYFSDPPYYLLEVEDLPADVAESLAGSMDRALGALNVEYRSKRDSGRLGRVRVRVLAAGTFARRQEREVSRRRGRLEQYKHRYLIPEVAPGPLGTGPSGPG